MDTGYSVFLSSDRPTRLRKLPCWLGDGRVERAGSCRWNTRYSRDRNCLHNPKNLTQPNFKQLQLLLKKEEATTLVQSIIIEAPSHIVNYCMSFHWTHRYVVYCRLQEMRRQLKLLQWLQRELIICCVKQLQDTAPVSASFILKLLFGRTIPTDVCSLISEICELLAPFQPSVP